MNIHDFAVEVSKLEGKKKQMSIAQIKEVMKCINKLLHGRLYATIKVTAFIEK